MFKLHRSQLKLALCALALSVITINKPALCEEIASVETSAFEATLKSLTSNSFRLDISFQEGLSRNFAAKMFELADPSRLVIDLPNVLSSGGDEAYVSDKKLHSLRLGVHEDKTRLVVDINDGRLLAVYSSKLIDPKNMVVQFSFDANDLSYSTGSNSSYHAGASKLGIPDQISPLKQAKPKPLPKLKKAPKLVTPKTTIPPIVKKKPSIPAPLPKFDDSDLGDEPPSIFPGTSTDADGMTLVSGVYYRTTTNGEEALFIDVTGLEKYTLKPQGENIFELKFPNSKLANSNLSYPQFPPENYRGFEVVIPRQNEKSVAFKIYTEENVKLLPFIAKGKLWIKTTR